MKEGIKQVSNARCRVLTGDAEYAVEKAIFYITQAESICSDHSERQGLLKCLRDLSYTKQGIKLLYSNRREA